MGVPELRGDALRAVRHRGSHLQIIACAGSGKTEVVAQRVAALFADGVEPSAVVAFTFTDRAAEELKHRIEERVEGRLGAGFLDRLNGCFVGTIHAYCFRLLQQHVSRYETYDVLDEHRLAAFLTRVSKAIGLKELEGQLFTSLKGFARNADVVENELIPLSRLEHPFRSVLQGFYTELERYRFLTYGQVIARAVEELEESAVFEAVHGKLRHLIVDEYQDINPAQERLIERLAQPPVELCVVGDDDQAIYQWRGSDVSNIVTFTSRYSAVATFSIVTNRRSRPGIIRAANGFASTIVGRLEKEMKAHRAASPPEIVCWREEMEAEEARRIAGTIEALKNTGFQYRDIAVLVRSSTSYDRLLEAFEGQGIPVQPAGRTGLFREPDAQLFGRTFAYLAGNEWRATEYGPPESVALPGLVDDYGRRFGLDRGRLERVKAHLKAWKSEVSAESRPADLIGDYYDLLGDCGVAAWDINDPTTVTRLGALARCSAILADYESTRRRSRPDPNTNGEVIGGQDRGEWYYRWLAIHIQNWALGAFEGFEGEESFTLDAVDLTTVHQAKGLEWPIVFVPCVTAKRFPSNRTGQSQTWYVPRRCFDRTRYEGTENDERRLFYVAMSRARDWLSVSSHDRPNRNRVMPSPFIRHVAGGDPGYVGSVALPAAPAPEGEKDDLLSITFSELADFKTCGLAYRLRNLIGFQPPLAPELGYGKAVHHVLRTVAEFTRRHRRLPSPLGNSS
jgi:DNA helicase-2/ATP-dependent DNA helicase PcrA